jgi:PHD/YefM family antitoxin component YafN of YafNO toxin-antitoxin module
MESRPNGNLSREAEAVRLPGPLRRSNVANLSSRRPAMNIQKPVTILSSRELNQDTGRAKRAASKGPVFITTRGEISHVLMTTDEFDRIEGYRSERDRDSPKSRSILDMLADDRPEADFDWEPPKMGSLAKHTDFD